MLKIERTEIPYSCWEVAIRGMRNPLNSWEKSDTNYDVMKFHYLDGGDPVTPDIGEADLGLMMRLAKGGATHAKYRRMLMVSLDITAPLYWWKEFDTYKVGTVANSCSTMHKIHAKEFTWDDFSAEHIGNVPNCDPAYEQAFEFVIMMLNEARRCYLDTNDKCYWHQMIQLLPTSYNQKRTVMLNYEVLVGIYRDRKNHKLDEWHTFCDWIRELPYSELITGGDE